MYGTGPVLSDERINENPFVTVAMWAPEYMIHLGTQIVSHISIWHRIGTITVKGASILKNGVDVIAELPDYLSTLDEITNDVGQLLKDETFFVDYTLSLATQSMTPLLKWGIIGVDTINSGLCSPGELRVFDSLDRVTGVINGKIVQEIPDSFYDSGASTVTIFNPTGSYCYEVAGTEEGSYGLDITYLEEGQVIIFTATDISTASEVVHQYTIDWDALSEDEEGVTMQVDSDGDGDFEEEIHTSQPNMPSISSPLNHASSVPVETDFSWMGGDPDAGDTVTYDVYFGTSGTPPLKQTVGPYPATQSSIIYDPGTLAGGTTYYWQIVARDNNGIAREGPVWDFSTGDTSNSPPQLSNPSVQPQSGTPATDFYYYVNYFDSDGDSPSTNQVYVDGMPYTTSLYSGSASNGVYRYGPKNISVGWGHNYYFYFEDGKGGTARLPNLGSYSGPTISDGECDPWDYDENHDGIIQKNEVLQAILDYFDGLITKTQVLEVLLLYFS